MRDVSFCLENALQFICFVLWFVCCFFFTQTSHVLCSVLVVENVRDSAETTLERDAVEGLGFRVWISLLVWVCRHSALSLFSNANNSFSPFLALPLEYFGGLITRLIVFPSSLVGQWWRNDPCPWNWSSWKAVGYPRNLKTVHCSFDQLKCRASGERCGRC